ncbi:MAG: NCS2 family permease [Planctomycetota bacterium]|jgi:AGZA family xanthine/uracil permease-like MFS transporter
MSATYPLFVKRDLDGFFGLFIDNLVQLLLIVALCGGLCGMSGDQAYLIFSRILPGAAVSLLIGNLFYAWQAHRLAAREGRSDVCALPYGINTPSLLVYVFFVIAPVYRASNDAVLAWQMGLVACLGSGLIEFCGSFVAERVRRHTPRAALLSTLAGIAIGFISMTFALQIYQNPLIAMLPLGVILITYFSRVRFPLGLPGGLLAILAGTIIAWVLPGDWLGRQMTAAAVSEAWSQHGLRLPVFCGGALLDAFRYHSEELLGYLSVIVPMGLFNVVGSLQNIESAEAGGDRFPTGPSLAVNGIGTIVAALFGSCFPTTIYIGHPGWKGLGARAGYSSLNGLVITVLALSGTVALISEIIPIEAGIAIVLWIGIVITAQAYQATPRSHAPAVAIGLFPAIAAWGATVAAGAFTVAGATSVYAVLEANLQTEVNGFLIHGMNLLSSGYIFTCMILAAISAYLIDGKFFRAGVWALVGAVLTFVGLMHAYQISGNDVTFYFVFSAPPAQGQGLAFHAFGIGPGSGPGLPRLRDRHRLPARSAALPSLRGLPAPPRRCCCDPGPLTAKSVTTNRGRCR